jgi:hypothetical protein
MSDDGPKLSGVTPISGQTFRAWTATGERAELTIETQGENRWLTLLIGAPTYDALRTTLDLIIHEVERETGA